MENATPSVLVILVVKDGAAWLARSLASLARQTHPRLGVVAVDNASTDGSADMLVSALTADRVIRLERNEGFPAALARGLDAPVARKADYVLFLHDDTALAPDAVAQLIEAARSAPGVGVVGPKVLDWDEPRMLREVGMAIDRFGYPHSPLEEGEIDQGQHDGHREVMFVTSAAMLVSRDVWTRVGPPDGRLGPAHADLDFCWRARLAGFRVLVQPRANVLHRGAGSRAERPGSSPERVRFHAERAALAAVLKNYGFLSLLWILPVSVAVGLARVATLLATRRFAAAGHVVMAWGWNALHFMGTIRRRARAQAVRTVSDREVVRLMVPAGARLRRWFLQATAPIAGGVGHMEPDEELVSTTLGRRLARMALEHPVALASVAAAFLSVVSFREVLFAGPVEGGVLPVFPERPGELLSAFADGWRTTTLGGPGGPSPALVPLSVLGYLTLGDARVLARLLVAAIPVLAGASCYRAVLRRTRQPAPAVVAAACFALSAPVLWAASEGSLSAGAFLVAAPWLLVRVGEAFEAARRVRSRRWMVGTGMGLAVAASFYPAVWVGGTLVLGVTFLAPGRWRAVPRGVGLVVLGAFAGAALVFPFVLELMDAGGGAAVGAAGAADAGAVLRLAPGAAPGGFLTALFLPVAAVVSFPLADDRRWAWRAALTVAAALPLAWLAAAGRLPDTVANPLAFLGVAAAAMSLLVGLGVRALLLGLSKEAFGYRQVAVGALTAVVGLGLLGQSADAARGAWAVGRGRIPPAWPVVATADGPPFRVLWLGHPGLDPFPPPGGAPDGVVVGEEGSLRYGVTARAGNTVLELGLPPDGPAYPALERALIAVLDGRVRHGGALLSPFGIRFVVAGAGDLPPGAQAQLVQQTDMDLIQTAGGLSIYEVGRPLPLAVGVGPEAARAVESTEAQALAEVVRAERAVLAPDEGAWQGPVSLEGSGAVLFSTPFDSRWRLSADGQVAPAFPAFGWAQGFRTTFPADLVRVEYQDGWIRALEIAVLGVLWALALWITRIRTTGRPAPAPPGPAEPERPARQPVQAAP
ncbi:MAG: glycosyltransferase [Actinomycetota bacterium]